MGHVNLKNNTPRMHHITPFWDKKHPQTPLPCPLTAPRFSRLRRSTCDPRNVPVALTPMVGSAIQRSSTRRLFVRHIYRTDDIRPSISLFFSFLFPSLPLPPSCSLPAADDGDDDDDDYDAGVRDAVDNSIRDLSKRSESVIGGATIETLRLVPDQILGP